MYCGSTSIGKDIKNCTKDVRHNNGSVNKTGRSNGTLKIWADVNSHALKAVDDSQAAGFGGAYIFAWLVIAANGIWAFVEFIMILVSKDGSLQ